MEAITQQYAGPPGLGEKLVILNLAHDNGALDASTINIRLMLATHETCLAQSTSKYILDREYVCRLVGCWGHVKPTTVPAEPSTPTTGGDGGTRLQPGRSKSDTTQDLLFTETLQLNRPAATCGTAGPWLNRADIITTIN